MQRRPAKRVAFTLIEVLVVIGIIAVLVTLVTYGMRSMVATGKIRSTHTTFENLKNMVTEKQVTGGAAFDGMYRPLWPQNDPGPHEAKAPRYFYKDNTGPDDERTPKWDTGQTPPTPLNTMAVTRQIMAALKAVPNNAKWLDSLPTEQKWMPMGPAGTPAAPFVLDAWGNPIIYVPAAGIANVTVSIPDQTGSPVSEIVVTAPDRRGFWASAGPDGLFASPDKDNNGPILMKDRKPFGDDNVYSFQKD